jgi:FtsP/CotA-like multicopper oxidase with cupredoxin domain/uncharacterized protein YceK
MRKILLIAALSAVSLLLSGCSFIQGLASSASGISTGVTRQYFIEAAQTKWNYAPTGSNQITGKAFTPDENVFVGRGPNRGGSTYVKCLYRGFTDATYSVPLKQPGYMGTLGPTIYAEVGDKVVVHYKNSCSFANSVHVHGFTYDKKSEGAPYNDSTNFKADDSVAPGASYTYHYTVPASAGPASMDGSTAMWMYHSHADEIADVYAGMTGFIVVTKHGGANPDGTPKDVDQSIFVLFEVDNENLSTLASLNFKTTPQAVRESDEFNESNMMHSINGFVYGNGPMPVLKKGSRVRWYLMGMGNEVDLHTPHWHGNTVTSMGMRTDVVSLLPGTMITADMTPDNPGIWLFHCHVADHIAAGMIGRYQVK